MISVVSTVRFSVHVVGMGTEVCAVVISTGLFCLAWMAFQKMYWIRAWENEAKRKILNGEPVSEWEKSFLKVRHGGIGAPVQYVFKKPTKPPKLR